MLRCTSLVAVNGTLRRYQDDIDVVFERWLDRRELRKRQSTKSGMVRPHKSALRIERTWNRGPLGGVKRTPGRGTMKSAFDPKQT